MKNEPLTNLIIKLNNATTKKEIIACKSEVTRLFNELSAALTNESFLCRTNYDDIRLLYESEDAMAAYYGFCFYQTKGFPFLEKNNPGTIQVIELTLLFYILQIIVLLEKGYFTETSLCVYIEEGTDLFDHTNTVDFCSRYSNALFDCLFQYLLQIQFVENDTREIPIWNGSKQDIFYVNDSQYEVMLDSIYCNIIDSPYAEIIDRILGIYHMRFTKVEYLYKYQPIFVKTAHKYWLYILRY